MNDKRLAFKIYLYLGAMFITSLVVSNLIFQKFFYWNPFGEVKVFGASLFEVSVGILPYPITFLITDLISEIFGKKKANQIVTAGIFASFFSMGIVLLADYAPAIESSPVNDEVFSKVFALSPIAVLASKATAAESARALSSDICSMAARAWSSLGMWFPYQEGSRYSS